MHPSIYMGATIGGSGGIGSCTKGVLRALGNILRLRVVTAEAEPRVIEFTGGKRHRVSHAHGTNGTITGVEMSLAPACDWVDVVVTHRDFATAVQIAGDIGHQDIILKKLISVYQAPTASAYFPRVAPHVTAEDALIRLMIAPHSMGGFLTFLHRHPGAKVIFRSDQTQWSKEPGPLVECGWNHTTLRDAVTGTLAARGWEVDLCDLYAEGFDQVLGNAEGRGYHDLATNTVPVQAHVDRLHAAQSLIFVHPVWNFGFPAILKGYTDPVFLPNVTFRLEDGDVRHAKTSFRRLASVTTYGARRLQAILACDPPHRVVGRAFWHACRPHRFRYLALCDMNRVDAARRAGFVTHVQRRMERF